MDYCGLIFCGQIMKKVYSEVLFYNSREAQLCLDKAHRKIDQDLGSTLYVTLMLAFVIRLHDRKWKVT